MYIDNQSRIPFRFTIRLCGPPAARFHLTATCRTKGAFTLAISFPGRLPGSFSPGIYKGAPVLHRRKKTATSYRQYGCDRPTRGRTVWVRSAGRGPTYSQYLSPRAQGKTPREPRCSTGRGTPRRTRKSGETNPIARFLTHRLILYLLYTLSFFSSIKLNNLI